jgi:tetratricopeptide (TPR) repeat protein
MMLAQFLFDDLVLRRIESGRKRIDREQNALRTIAPTNADAPYVVYVLAGWAEYSAVASEIVGNLLADYSKQGWPDISISAWGFIQTGMATLASCRGHEADVAMHFQWLEQHAAHLRRKDELLGTAQLAMARIKKRKGAYIPALDLALLAASNYSRAGLPGMEAVARIIEAWTLGQLGRTLEAQESFARASTWLDTTEDCALRGYIAYAEARRLRHSDLEEQARSAYKKAADLYLQSVPPHRTLRRVLLDWADLEYRMSSASKADACRAELCKSAAAKVNEAINLIDSSDFRNKIRLKLVQVNEALHGPAHSYANARSLAKEAYDIARSKDDHLMMARALYKQAKIEHYMTRNGACDNLVRLMVRALQHLAGALKLANDLDNARLIARIHTLRATILFEFPFCDKESATEEFEAAVKAMQHRQDSDYIARKITHLEQRLRSPVWTPKAK